MLIDERKLYIYVYVFLRDPVSSKSCFLGWSDLGDWTWIKMRRSPASIRFPTAHLRADLLLAELSMPTPIARALPIWPTSLACKDGCKTVAMRVFDVSQARYSLNSSCLCCKGRYTYPSEKLALEGASGFQKKELVQIPPLLFLVKS